MVIAKRKTLTRATIWLLASVLALFSLAVLTSSATRMAEAAPLLVNTTAAGFNSYAWTKDRTEPFAYSKVQDKLSLTVDTTTTYAPNSTTFYKYEGFTSNPTVTPFPTNTTSIRASLYIDPDWKNKPVSASMWGQATSNGVDTAWPMIGFANSFEQSYTYAPGDDAFVGFRVYDTVTTGLWTDVLPVGDLWGKTVDLEISANPNTGKFEFFINSNKVHEYAHEGYSRLKGVIFNNVNVKDDNPANKYYVKWTNLQTGRVTPDGAPQNVRLVRNDGTAVASGRTVNFTDVKLWWDTVEEAARYRVTVTHPDGSTTNFQPSTTATWNPDSISYAISDAVRNGLFGKETGDKGEGKYSYTVAVQLGGKWSAESSPVEITLDTTKPGVEVIYPANNGDFISDSGSVKIKATDNLNLKSVVVHLTNTDTGARPANGTCLWKTHSVNGADTTVVCDLTGLADGHYSLAVASTDMADGSSYGSRSFIIDSAPTEETVTVEAAVIARSTVPSSVLPPIVPLVTDNNPAPSTAAPSATDNVETPQVLGASDEDKNKDSSPLKDTASVLGGDTKNSSVAWYLWLAALAVIAAGWWFIAAVRRRKDEE